MPRAKKSVRKKRNGRQSAEVRRHDIIEAAWDIVRRGGVAGLTTRSLSQAVGIAQPTLFLHFGSKSQVLIALVDAIEQRLREGLKDPSLQELSPLERLKTVIRFQLRFIERQPGIPRLLFSEELQSGDPKFRNRMNRMVKGYLDFLAGLLAAAQDAGEVRRDIVPGEHACLLIASVQGLAFRWILSNRRFDLAAQAETIISALIDGWAVREPAPRAARVKA
jgi:AcrR family transcriptional regulator